MNRECFLCGEDIEDKNSKEHIFGDSFLAWMNLKDKKFKYNNATSEKEYTRLKVNSHIKCNNEFGSRFEEYILKILKNLSSNQDVLSKLHIRSNDPVISSIKEVLSQWMFKVYIGLVYWEKNLRSHPSVDYQSTLVDQINDPVVKQLQKCFKNEYKFNVPSSLYYFNIPGSVPSGLEFDFATGLPFGLIYVKFNEHLLVASIADSYLVEEWFTDYQYRNTQSRINSWSASNPIAYLYAVSHIWAVRENLPIQPSLAYSENAVTDYSRMLALKKPEINAVLVEQRAIEIYNGHTLKYGVVDA